LAWLNIGPRIFWQPAGQLNSNTVSVVPFAKYNEYHELEHAIVLDILPDRSGREWLCSNMGFYEYSADSGIVARYSAADTGCFFLPAKQFQHFYQDADGIYWIATATGLIRWDKECDKYQLFTREDGLSNNNIY